MECSECPKRETHPGRTELCRPFTLFAVSMSLFLLSTSGLTVSPQGIKNYEAKLDSQVTVKQWKNPQSGWLYALDSNEGRDSSKILLLNLKQGAVVGVIESGYAPDMTLSPDGKRLFVVSGAPGRLSVIDTESGTVLRNFPVRDRLIYMARPSVPSLVVSPDGRWLHIMKMSGGPPNPVYYGVATFDTYNDYALTSETPIPGCGVGRFIGFRERALLIHCFESNDIRVLRSDAAGKVVPDTAVVLPLVSHPLAVAGEQLPRSYSHAPYISVLPGDRTAAIFTTFGAVLGLDMLTQHSWPTTIREQVDRWVPFRDWPRSPNGNMIYVGSGPLRNRSVGEANEIDVFDTETWQIVGTIKTSMPFWSLALTKDGRYLYAMSSTAKSVLLIDTSTRQEIGTLRGIGTSPTLAIVAP